MQLVSMSDCKIKFVLMTCISLLHKNWFKYFRISSSSQPQWSQGEWSIELWPIFHLSGSKSLNVPNVNEWETRQQIGALAGCCFPAQEVQDFKVCPLEAVALSEMDPTAPQIKSSLQIGHDPWHPSSYRGTQRIFCYDKNLNMNIFYKGFLDW